MPRDFVPCVYREQVLESRLLDRGAFSCDVIELFAFSRLENQETATRMSLNSHQFTLRQECLLAPDGVPALRPGDRQPRLRAPLFAQFYAAMAALE